MARRFVFALVGVTMAASCVSAGDDCAPDPSRSTISATGCVWSGRMAQYVRDRETELAQLRASIELTQAETRLITVQAQRLAADEAAYDVEIAAQMKKLAALENDLGRARQASDDDRARANVARRELDELRRLLSAEKDAARGSEARIAELTAEIAKRSNALKAFSKPIITE